MSLPRYSYRIYSVPIASQVYEYEKEQLLFSNSLNKELQKELTVRLHPTSRGYDQVKRYRDYAPTINLESTKKNIYDGIKENRLIVCTYNATTILECIVANVPTVMFWNPYHWELNDYASPHFEKLKEVNILHNDAKSAAEFINKNWKNIEEWWFDQKTQNVLKTFKKNYARNEKNWKTKWVEAISECL